MATNSDVFRLKYKYFPVDDNLPLRLKQVFEDIETAFKLLQIYQNTVGKSIDEKVTNSGMDEEGNIPTSKLEGAIETLNNQIVAGAGTVTITEDNGILIVDNDEAPTKALRLLGGMFAISNEKDEQGNWIWRTFGTGDGFVADRIISGILDASLIRIVGDDDEGNPVIRIGHYEGLGPQTATFTRDSVAYKQDGTQVAAGVPRFESVDGRQGILIEEGTTNLVLNPSFEEGSGELADGWYRHIAPGISANTWVDNNVHRASGSKSQVLQVTGATSTNSANILGTGIPITPGKTYTISGYFMGSFVNAAPFLILEFHDANGAWVSGYSFGMNTQGFNPNTWTRVTGTLTAPENCPEAQVYIQVWCDPGANGYLYADDVQLEEKPYVTSWTGETVRQPEKVNLPLDILNGNEGTIEGWFMLNDVGDHYSPIFATVPGYSPGPRLLIARDMYTNCLYAFEGDSSIGHTQEIQANTMYYFQFKWSTTFGRKITLNDTGVAGSNIAPLPTDQFTELVLGLWGSISLNGLLFDLRVSNKWRTDEETSAAYASNEPMQVDEHTTYKLSFDGNLQPTVLAFGQYIKNGRFILQDPQKGEGIELWEGDNKSLLIGRLDDGSIGINIGTGKIEGGTWIFEKTALGVNTQLDGYGSGQDGDFNSEGDVTIELEMEDVAPVVKQYKSFTLNSGHTLTVNKRCRGLFIFCQEDVIINGTIDMSGKGAKVSKSMSVQQILQIPLGFYTLSIPSGGSGGDGGSGGKGAHSTSATEIGYGGSRGYGTSGTWYGGGFGGAGGGGGSGEAYNDETRDGGDAGDSDLDSPIGLGGGNDNYNGDDGGNFSGGGGARSAYSEAYTKGGGGGGGSGVYGGEGGNYGATDGESGGGIGGGLVCIVARGNVTIGSSGKILCNGLDGGDGGRGGGDWDNKYSYEVSPGGGGGGQGGGGGGVIVIAYHGSYSNSGTVQVNGGLGGSGGSRGYPTEGYTSGSYGVSGGSGSAGTVGTIVLAKL